MFSFMEVVSRGVEVRVQDGFIFAGESLACVCLAAQDTQRTPRKAEATD